MKNFVVIISMLVVLSHFSVMADFLGGGGGGDNAATEDNKQNEESVSKKASDMGDVIGAGASAAKQAVIGCDFNKCLVDISKEMKAYATIVGTFMKSGITKNNEAFTVARENLKRIYEDAKEIFGF